MGVNLAQATSFYQKGNYRYRMTEYHLAIKYYTEACTLILSSECDADDYRLLIKSLINLSDTYIEQSNILELKINRLLNRPGIKAYFAIEKAKDEGDYLTKEQMSFVLSEQDCKSLEILKDARQKKIEADKMSIDSFTNAITAFNAIKRKNLDECALLQFRGDEFKKRFRDYWDGLASTRGFTETRGYAEDGRKLIKTIHNAEADSCLERVNALTADLSMDMDVEMSLESAATSISGMSLEQGMPSSQGMFGRSNFLQLSTQPLSQNASNFKSFIPRNNPFGS